jgi:hypothetical protein
VVGDRCEGCAEGWTGRYCGTLADASAHLAAVLTAAVVAALLALALLLLLVHRLWRPVRARGILSATLGLCCAAVWLYVALATLSGEAMGFDAGNTSQGRVCHEAPISTERSQRYIRS